LESRAGNVLRQIQEAKANRKKLPKRFRVNNLLIDVEYSVQTKLVELSDDEAVKLL